MNTQKYIKPNFVIHQAFYNAVWALIMLLHVFMMDDICLEIPPFANTSKMAVSKRTKRCLYMTLEIFEQKNDELVFGLCGFDAFQQSDKSPGAVSASNLSHDISFWHWHDWEINSVHSITYQFDTNERIAENPTFLALGATLFSTDIVHCMAGTWATCPVL
jgi:hypothetical protein